MENRIFEVTQEDAQEARQMFAEACKAVVEGKYTEAHLRAICGRSGSVKHDRVAAFVAEVNGTTWHLRQIISRCPVTSVEGKSKSYNAESFVSAAHAVFSDPSLYEPKQSGRPKRKKVVEYEGIRLDWPQAEVWAIDAMLDNIADRLTIRKGAN